MFKFDNLMFFHGCICITVFCFVFSGDGTMGVFNIKRRRFEVLSEFQNGDLTSVSIMKVSLNNVSVAN